MLSWLSFLGLLIFDLLLPIKFVSFSLSETESSSVFLNKHDDSEEETEFSVSLFPWITLKISFLVLLSGVLLVKEEIPLIKKEVDEFE